MNPERTQNRALRDATSKLDTCDSQVLRAMLGMEVTEEQLQSIAERAIQEADLDRDDAISFDEFRTVRRSSQ